MTLLAERTNGQMLDRELCKATMKQYKSEHSKSERKELYANAIRALNSNGIVLLNDDYVQLIQKKESKTAQLHDNHKTICDTILHVLQNQTDYEMDQTSLRKIILKSYLAFSPESSKKENKKLFKQAIKSLIAERRISEFNETIKILPEKIEDVESVEAISSNKRRRAGSTVDR